MELMKKYKWLILFISFIGLNISWSTYSNQIDKSRVYLDDSESITEEAPLESALYDTALEEDKNRSNEGIKQSVSPSPQKFPVYVCGEVKNPGVYYVFEGDIVNDAIEKSGGFTGEANILAVNLARTMEANEKIIIPAQGEEIDKLMDSYDNRERTEEKTIVQAVSNDHAEEKININSASKELLMTLNGIGEVKASAIIAYRQENGEFNSIDEIKNISGIGEKTFEKIKQFITT